MLQSYNFSTSMFPLDSLLFQGGNLSSNILIKKKEEQQSIANERLVLLQKHWQKYLTSLKLEGYQSFLFLCCSHMENEHISADFMHNKSLLGKKTHKLVGNLLTQEQQPVYERKRKHTLIASMVCQRVQLSEHKVCLCTKHHCAMQIYFIYIHVLRGVVKDYLYVQRT